MKIEGTHEIGASRQRVYQSLIDPEVLRRCIPGCERLESTGENVFAATIRAGVGSIKGLFNGSVKMEDMRPPEHYRLAVEAKGTPGFLKGGGDLDLEEKGERTLIRYSGDVQVGGTIAGVGQRMIQATARMLASQFFTALDAESNTDSGESPPKHGFFRTALRWLSGWLRRTFRGRRV